MRSEAVPTTVPERYLGAVIDVLQKFAEYEKVKLPEDAALYIARTVQFNAGSLESALGRVIAYSLLTGTAITLATTQKVLQGNIEEQRRPVALDSLPEISSARSGRQKAKVRFSAAKAPGEDFVLCLLEGHKIRQVRNQLQVNMRESERELLANLDAHDWGLLLRWAKKRQLG